MRRSIAFAMPFLIIGAANAQSPSGAAFQDICEGPWGNFSHWSSILGDNDHQTEVGWAVCNLDKTVPLIFSWDAPNISLGPGGKLPAGRCATLDLPVPAEGVEADTRASISYTQGSRNCPAPAYAWKLKSFIPESILPHNWVTHLRTFYGAGGQPNYARLKLSESRDGDRIHHSISWNPPEVIIALSPGYFENLAATRVAEAVASEGYEVHEATLSDLVSQDGGGLSDDVMSSKVIAITNNKRIAPFEFAILGAGPTTIGSSRLTLIDPVQKSVIISVVVSGFALPQGR